jgi:hypothetical protein
MSIPDDDVDTLISRLSRPLEPADRPAFEAAARATVAALPDPGPGSIYRALKPIQREHFAPPSSERAGWDIEQVTRTHRRAKG